MEEVIIEEFKMPPEQEVVKEFKMPPEQPIGVYIKINSNKEIVSIDSDIFIQDLSGYIKIDEGFGDKYAHAQSQYFDKALLNEDGTYNYKYIKGEIIEK